MKCGYGFEGNASCFGVFGRADFNAKLLSVVRGRGGVAEWQNTPLGDAAISVIKTLRGVSCLITALCLSRANGVHGGRIPHIRPHGAHGPRPTEPHPTPPHFTPHYTVVPALLWATRVKVAYEVPGHGKCRDRDNDISCSAISEKNGNGPPCISYGRAKICTVCPAALLLGPPLVVSLCDWVGCRRLLYLGPRPWGGSVSDSLPLQSGILFAFVIYLATRHTYSFWRPTVYVVFVFFSY